MKENILHETLLLTYTLNKIHRQNFHIRRIPRQNFQMTSLGTGIDQGILGEKEFQSFRLFFPDYEDLPVWT